MCVCHCWGEAINLAINMATQPNRMSLKCVVLWCHLGLNIGSWLSSEAAIVIFGPLHRVIVCFASSFLCENASFLLLLCRCFLLLLSFHYLHKRITSFSFSVSFFRRPKQWLTNNISIKGMRIVVSSKKNPGPERNRYKQNIHTIVFQVVLNSHSDASYRW